MSIKMIKGISAGIVKFPRLANIGLRILYSKALSKRIPIVVSFHINNRCNLRCKYCYANVDDRFDLQEADLSYDEITAIIDDMYEAGTRWLIILGGEPLLRDDLGEIIRYAKSKSMLCEVVTNGTLVAQRIDQLKEVDLLCISIDGDEAANDATRGKGSYERIITGIKAASQNRLRTRLHAVLTRYNANERNLSHLEKLSEEYDCSFGYSSPIYSGHNNMQEHAIDWEGEREFWKMVRAYKSKSKRLYNTYNAIDNVLSWPIEPGQILKSPEDLLKLGDYKPKKCFMGHREAYIDNQGYLYACISRGVTQGLNVREVGFKKAWDDLASFSCGACSYIQYSEMNDVLDIKMHSIMLGIKTFFTGK